MPYKYIQVRDVHMCDAPSNCDRISSPSIETESQKEKEDPEKENVASSSSASLDKGQPFRYSDNAGSFQRKPL